MQCTCNRRKKKKKEEEEEEEEKKKKKTKKKKKKKSRKAAYSIQHLFICLLCSARQTRTCTTPLYSTQFETHLNERDLSLFAMFVQ